MFAQNLSARLKKWLSLPWIQLVLILLLLISIRFHPFLFNQTPIYGDNFSLMVPGKLFSAYWLKQGVFPLWNPTLLGGIPWVGDINQSLYYPSTWLFALVSPGWALNINLIIHLVLTFIGTYLVAKRLKIKHLGALVAAIIWTLSPQMVGAINNLSVVQSLAWMPWIVLAGINLSSKAKTWPIFALLVMVQFAAGYPQHILFSILLGVIFSGLTKSKSLPWLKWGQSWIITGMMTVGLSAWLWLPFIDNLLSSTRMVQDSTQLTTGSLHPVELIKVIFPYLFEKPTVGYRWGVNWNGSPMPGIYVSWLGLWLPFLIWKNKLFKSQDKIYLGVIVLTLLISLGENIPGFVFLQRLLPLGQAMRGPSVILVITAFISALWMGDLTSRLKPKIKSSLLDIKLIFGFLMASLLLGIIYFNFEWLYQLMAPYLSGASFFNYPKLEILLTSFSTHLWLHLLFLGLSWWGLRKFKPLLIIALIGEMTFFTQGHLFFAPTSLYDLDPQPIFAELKDSQSRVLTRNFNQAYTDFGAYWDALSIRQPFLDSYIDQEELDDWRHLQRMKVGLTPDWNMAIRVPAIHGYTTLMPQDMDQLFNHTNQVGINNLPSINLDEPLIKDWAVKYYLVDTWFPYPNGVEDLVPIAEKEHWQLYQLEALSRFRFEDQMPVIFESFQEHPNKVSFIFENDRHQQLIMADRYDADWQAQINGQQTEVINHQGMRLINLQPGKNVVELRYVPRWLYLGLAISGISALCSWWWIFLKISNF